jgi:small subunit ribosomal protein S10
MLREYKVVITSHSLNSIKKTEEHLKKLDCKNKKIILPKKKKIFTLLKSPHVNSKAKEHFKLEKYRRLFYLKVSLSVLKSFLEGLPNDLNIKIVEFN